MKALAAVFAAALSLAACASSQSEPAPAPAFEPGRSPAMEHELEWLTGAWSNAEQYAAAPDALKREPAPGHPYDWLDLQYAEFTRIDAPRVGDYVVYLEWRAGGPDGPISRQRIWSFLADAQGRPAGMDFYTFNNPDLYAGRAQEPWMFADLSPEDLTGYPDGCTLSPSAPASVGIFYRLNPATCTITARSGRTMALRADIQLHPGRLTYSEAGVLESGAYAFLVPGGRNFGYEFRPVETGEAGGTR
jgi:hypothetical protein